MRRCWSWGMMMMMMMIMMMKRRRRRGIKMYWQPLFGRNPARVLSGQNAKSVQESVKIASRIQSFAANSAASAHSRPRHASPRWQTSAVAFRSGTSPADIFDWRSCLNSSFLLSLWHHRLPGLRGFQAKFRCSISISIAALLLFAFVSWHSLNSPRFPTMSPMCMTSQRWPNQGPSASAQISQIKVAIVWQSIAFKFVQYCIQNLNWVSRPGAPRDWTSKHPLQIVPREKASNSRRTVAHPRILLVCPERYGCGHQSTQDSMYLAQSWSATRMSIVREYSSFKLWTWLSWLGFSFKLQDLVLLQKETFIDPKEHGQLDRFQDKLLWSQLIWILAEQRLGLQFTCWMQCSAGSALLLPRCFDFSFIVWTLNHLSAEMLQPAEQNGSTLQCQGISHVRLCYTMMSAFM